MYDLVVNSVPYINHVSTCLKLLSVDTNHG